MATYREIQDDIRRLHQRAFKTCWIADVKHAHGLTTRIAHNRASHEERKHPCPAELRPIIEDSIRRFGMIV